VTVIPARVRRPRDKAKAEVGVQVVERWILAALRHRQCFSLAELNRAIRELLETLNHRPFRKLPGTRRALFEQLDKPALRPLPVDAYEYAEWKQARVHIDYHVEVRGHYCSVPHALIKKQVDVRITANIIECFCRGRRIASHRRSHHKGRHTTVTAHMPETHRQAGEWSPQRLERRAARIGTATARRVRHRLTVRQHPRQACRSCSGILRPGNTCGNDRLEAACRRALTLGSHSCKRIESILRHGLDRQPLAEQTGAALPEDHDNIRGPSCYH
jgi:transposase